jgi:NAD(P)-dependent dehydrogenase (short-subunit alcohol dehydrogenase family)
MLMSVIEPELASSVYGELAGARVLITGLRASGGVDVARSFADHRARLIIQTDDLSPELVELTAHLGEHASEIRLFDEPLDCQESAVRLAQKSATAYGGFDVVVNFIDARPPRGLPGDFDEISDYVSDTLLPATLVTRVAANRMRLMRTEGSILNIVSMPPPANARARALSSVVRATLSDLTRREAQTWADAGIRVNAIGPRSADGLGHCLASEPEIASLALYLASRKGRELSGQVFDAENASLHC